MDNAGNAGKRTYGYLPLLASNFFGVVNDNFLKTLACFVAVGWVADANMQSLLVSATAGMLVVPYILFSPLADRLTVVFSKKRIFRLAKWAELPIVAVAIAGFLAKSPALVILGVLLMGLQSSLYSPAKYALVRDVGGAEKVSVGMGLMEGATFLAVLSGTVAASFASDRASAAEYGVALGAFALLGLAGSYAIRADEEPNRAIHSINPIRYVRRACRMAKGYPGLNSVIFTLSVFWWAGAMLQIGLLVYGKEVLHLDSTHTGMMLAIAAVGIVVGQVVAGYVDRRHFLLGATPLTGWLAAALLAVLFFVPMGPKPFAVVLAVLALDFGFFKLPLDAEIQKTVKGPRLNTMLAYFNQVSFLFMLAASVVYALAGWLFGPRAFLLVLAAAFAVVPLAFMMSYRSVMCRVGRWIFRRRYDVAVDGGEALETGRTCLVLPNHPAMVDPMLVVAEFWRTPLRPLADESFFRTGIVAPKVLRTLGGVEVPDLRKHRSGKGATVARGLAGIVVDTLEKGGSVIFYPSGHIHVDPELEPPGDGPLYAPSGEPRESIATRQLAYNVCRELPPGVDVIGVRTVGLWGGIWSRKGRRSSPKFVPTFVKSVFLWLFWSPFHPRRKVTMHVENLTERVREWSRLTRLEFNRKLEDWYNSASLASEAGKC